MQVAHFAWVLEFVGSHWGLRADNEETRGDQGTVSFRGDHVVAPFLQ